MHDVRLDWIRKFSYMSPADFQAAQVEAKQEREERERAQAETSKRVHEGEEDRPSKRRKRFQASDFGTPFASPKEVEEWFARFPAVSKRNFYVVQDHHATRDHHDLRLQLDGKTVSWAIPNTLSNLNPKTMRLAVETIPHSISYTFLEGSVASGRSTTGCVDLGTYRILKTKTKEAELQKKKQAGLDDADTTDEEESRQPEDEQQEDLFRDALAYGSYLPTPTVEGRPGKPAPKDNGHAHGFVVELNGERYKGLRLTFARTSKDWWRVTFSSPSGVPFADTEVSPEVLHPAKSLLTGRTMDEIHADSVAWLEAILGGADDNDASSSSSADERQVGKGLGKRKKEGRKRRIGKSEAAAIPEEVQRVLFEGEAGEEPLDKVTKFQLQGTDALRDGELDDYTKLHLMGWDAPKDGELI
ncbi:hypothetical protein JCM8097_003539 [Rhodosporidiobolus ruineniae]